MTRDRLPRDLRAWGHHAVVAVVGVAAPFSLFAFGEQRVSSVLAGIWNSITPLVVLPMAVLVFRTEKMTSRRLIGLALGFVGALVILGVWQGVGGSSLAGQLMCLAAAACYGVSIPYVRKYVTPMPQSGVVSSLCQLLIASALLAIAAPVFSGGFPDLLALSWPVVASVAALGVFGTGLAFVLHLRNIRLAGASNASTVTYIIPIFATIIGVVVLQEPLDWYRPGRSGDRAAGCRGGVRDPAGTAPVKETELWERLRTHLGQGYYRVWAAEFSLADLGGRTVNQAIADGLPSKIIWRAVWQALELPARER